MFIPRVNTEVIVNFLNGDPDRPIAIGSLYNGNNKIPKDLPSNKTQSYIKTRSMPGDNSQYNLLLFEDRAGSELVHIRAQKDYKLHALHDSMIDIDHDQTETVGNDEHFTVGNNETVTIGKDHSLSIGHDQTLHISHTQNYRIDQDKVGYIGNQILEEVYADRTYKTGGHYRHTVNGKMELKAGERIKEVTKVYTVSGSDKVVIKGSGGTIILDGSGIILKGNVTVKGNVAISAGSPEAVAKWSAVANESEEICWECLLKGVMGK